MKWQTFDEWSNQGYQIKKGSRGVTHPERGVLFSERQVRYSPKRGNNFDMFKSSNGTTARFYADSFDA